MEYSNNLLPELMQTTDCYGAGVNTKVYSSGVVEIAAIVSGSGTHTVLGQDIPCSEGDIFIVNVGVIHGFSSSGTLTVRKLFFNPVEWLNENRLDATEHNYCFGVFSESSSVAYARLTQGARERIGFLYDSIEKEYAKKRHEWQSAVGSYLSLILITVGRYMTDAIKNLPPSHSKGYTLVAAAMREVSERYSDSTLTLVDIANRLYVSESHLSRLFKQITGQSFSEYLRGVRIDRACNMLASTDATVEEIVSSCGLRDIPSFYHSFSKATGLTPAKYRLEKSDKKGELKMEIIREISETLQKGRAKLVKELVQKAIDAGANVEEILNDGLLHGMNIVGEKFKNNEVYVPEVLIAARAMEAGTQILKPLLVSKGVKATGKVCIGTVAGDMHDIGKNLVRMMMEGKGLEVIDLGTDVPAEKFVQTAIDEGCQVICCSALLTTTMDVMKEVVDAAEAAGIRDKVKIMVGGAPVNEDFCKKIGADCYTSDAASAANAAVELCK